MSDGLMRERAYQAYINEMMANGNTRITNITLSNGGDHAEQHIATQVDLAFQAGWSACATLAADPLTDPRVKALVEALEGFTDDSDCHDEVEWFEARLKVARATLAAIEGEQTDDQ